MSSSVVPEASAHRPGVLSDGQLWDLIRAERVRASPPIQAEQVQPNSIDLRLGPIAHRTRCSFLPVGQPVRALLDDLATNEVSLAGGFVLECGQPYIVPLVERLDLSKNLFGYTNPKSSTGRLDIMARVLTDQGHSFDVIPAGYSGALYLELIARSFPIRIAAGDSLAQLRVLAGTGVEVTDGELRELIDQHQMVRHASGVPIAARDLEFGDGVFLTVDLGGNDRTVGYRAKRCTPIVDLRARELRVDIFWDKLKSPVLHSDPLILDSNGFYIFASRERIVVPPELSAEMVAVDVRNGEVRTHYAGFFDSGFGLAADPKASRGAKVVLEVRNMDVPFLLQDGQKLFRLRFFRNSARPDRLYGLSMASNYQGQGLKLGKQFAAPAES